MAEMIEIHISSKRIFQPQAWTPSEALRLLRDVPAFEASGILVRVPDWWSPKNPPRAKVSVSVGAKAPRRFRDQAGCFAEPATALTRRGGIAASRSTKRWNFGRGDRKNFGLERSAKERLGAAAAEARRVDLDVAVASVADVATRRGASAALEVEAVEGRAGLGEVGLTKKDLAIVPDAVAAGRRAGPPGCALARHLAGDLAVVAGAVDPASGEGAGGAYGEGEEHGFGETKHGGFLLVDHE